MLLRKRRRGPEMGAYSKTEISRLIGIGKDKSLSTKERGDALESLVCYLLKEIPGVLTRSNGIDPFRGSEIDISVANAQTGMWMNVLPSLFLVECKNWDAPVDVKAVGAFILKLHEKGVELGVMVAANGVTGNQDNLTAAYMKINLAQQAGRRVLVVTLDDLKTLGNPEEFSKLLCERMLECVAAGRF
ncbi:restriction endonuclease [Streptomyces mirabilis]|uniref:restriction endonuclease n=1 Tax=Streptomyces mirabilis TaxID=68239 RepID=UPI0033177D78